MFEFEQIVQNKPIKDTKVMVAMSGGVDSSTVAVYLHHLGYQVIGVTLQLYTSEEKQFKKTCCAGQDIYDAKNIASQFGFPHYVINLEKVFQEEVINDFAETYLRGETPIPCVKCNQTVKFRDLFKIAKDLKVDALVTGHYVRRIENSDGIELHKGIDSTKDQSYFLFATTKEQLKFLRFPLGKFTKEDTRKLAQSLNISISQKPESQDICFVKSKSYVDIINKLKPKSYEPGDIIHINGEILGKHNGIVNYTVGQRHGLNISYSEPLYVVKINSTDNKIIVGPKLALKKEYLYIKELNWLDDKEFYNGMEVSVKLRSGAEIVNATLIKENHLIKVMLLDEPKCAISPGQACVMYSNTKILGGGWIINNKSI
jgi:tRNA-specific 2-thiouridylase